jgi:hypothetical protein
MKNGKLMLFIGVLLMTFISCKKELPSKEIPKELTSLIEEFNLQPGISGTKPTLKFETVDDAQKFLNELRDSISNISFNGKISLIDDGHLVDGSKGKRYIVSTPSFEDFMNQNASTKDEVSFHTTRVGAGVLSSFVLTFQTSGDHQVDCESVNITVTGLALGWSWEQTSTFCQNCGWRSQ